MPIALTAGVDYFEFWKMTAGELYLVCKTYQDKIATQQKLNVKNNYDLACMIASFVCGGLDGKSPQKIEQIYPNLFKDEEAERQENLRAAMIKEQWIDFANNRKKLKNQGGKRI